MDTGDKLVTADGLAQSLQEVAGGGCDLLGWGNPSSLSVSVDGYKLLVVVAYGGAALGMYFACTVIPLYYSPSYISGSHFYLTAPNEDVQFIYLGGKATFNAEVGEIAVYGIK